jgi:hypothetical protein
MKMIQVLHLDYNAQRFSTIYCISNNYCYGNGSGADESLAGSMSLFNPSFNYLCKALYCKYK